MKLIRVALDLPLPRLFDYLAEDAQESDIGRLVSVPFGTGSKVGIVIALSTVTDQPAEKLKAALSILRDMPALPASFLALCEFCARYYQAPLGEVMAFALPPMLRRGKLPRAERKTIVLDGVSPAPTDTSGRVLGKSF